MAEAREASGIRRAEIVALLAAATALTVGQSPESLFDGTRMAVAMARRLGWPEAQVSTVYWYGLLRFAGCNAEAHDFSALIGDEVEFNRRLGRIDAQPRELVPLLVGMIRAANAGRSPLALAAAVAGGLLGSRQGANEMIAGHCDVAQRLAIRLGFDEAVVAALGQFRERWDGKGSPRGIKGEALQPAVRLVLLCHDAATLAEAFGMDEAIELIGRRRGSAYDPKLVDFLLGPGRDLLEAPSAADRWRPVIDAEPGPAAVLNDDDVDEACAVMADFIDLKLLDAISHSRAVAGLADAAASTLGLPAEECRVLHRAALLHDLGYAGVPVRSRGGHGGHPPAEMKLHPFHGEEMVGRVAALRAVAGLLGRHHEACDGSGFYRGLNGAALSPAARLLAAAETYQTLAEGRFGGPTLDAAGAAAAFRAEITAGRIDPDAGRAVLAAAGHKVPAKRRDLLAGLTNRELEILRLVARGKSMKEVGAELGISPKTVDNHLQNLYPKIGVKTRAGATLFAIEHGLCTLPN